MRNYNKMWDWIQDELTSLAEINYDSEYPELALISAIVIQAAKDRDMEYLKSDNFYYHCKLLRLNFMYVAAIVKKAYEMEDNGEDFTLPSTRAIPSYEYIDEDDDE